MAEPEYSPGDQVVRFTSVVNNKIREESDGKFSNLLTAEESAQCAKQIVGKPLRVYHDPALVVGRVIHSVFDGKQLTATGEIPMKIANFPVYQAGNHVLAKAFDGVSLSTKAIKNTKTGEIVANFADDVYELSLCQVGHAKREGCDIIRASQYVMGKDMQWKCMGNAFDDPEKLMNDANNIIHSHQKKSGTKNITSTKNELYKAPETSDNQFLTKIQVNSSLTGFRMAQPPVENAVPPALPQQTTQQQLPPNLTPQQQQQQQPPQAPPAQQQGTKRPLDEPINSEATKAKLAVDDHPVVNSVTSALLDDLQRQAANGTGASGGDANTALLANIMNALNAEKALREKAVADAEKKKAEKNRQNLLAKLKTAKELIEGSKTEDLDPEASQAITSALAYVDRIQSGLGAATCKSEVDNFTDMTAFTLECARGISISNRDRLKNKDQASQAELASKRREEEIQKMRLILDQRVGAIGSLSHQYQSASSTSGLASRGISSPWYLPPLVTKPANTAVEVPPFGYDSAANPNPRAIPAPSPVPATGATAPQTSSTATPTGAAAPTATPTPEELKAAERNEYWRETVYRDRNGKAIYDFRPPMCGLDRNRASDEALPPTEWNVNICGPRPNMDSLVQKGLISANVPHGGISLAHTQPSLFMQISEMSNETGAKHNLALQNVSDYAPRPPQGMEVHNVSEWISPAK